MCYSWSCVSLVYDGSGVFVSVCVLTLWLYIMLLLWITYCGSPVCNNFDWFEMLIKVCVNVDVKQ